MKKDVFTFYLCDQQRLCCNSSTCGRQCIYTDDINHAIIKDARLRNYDIDEQPHRIIYWESELDYYLVD